MVQEVICIIVNLISRHVLVVILRFLKLLVEEVEHMQFLLHKAASTKKRPDTSLSRER